MKRIAPANPRKRKCRVCPERYQPRNGMQVVCSPGCAIEWTRQQSEKKARKEKQAGLIRLRSRSDWEKLAQNAFNAYIRERDSDQPCISCGAPPRDGGNGGLWDCGHYRTVGAAPELRYHEDNAHKQCKACNSGVIRSKRRVHTVHDPERQATIRAQYRERLLVRIGLERVEWLEGPHPAANRSIADLEQIATTYRQKLRELRKKHRAI